MEREKLRLDKREQSIYAHKAWGLHCNVKYVLQYVPLIPKGWIQNPFFFWGGGTNVWKILDRGYSL